MKNHFNNINLYVFSDDCWAELNRDSQVFRINSLSILVFRLICVCFLLILFIICLKNREVNLNKVSIPLTNLSW